MTEGAIRVPKANNWADEIDDLHHDATEKRLQAVFFARARDRVGSAGMTEDPLTGAQSAERGPSAGGTAQ